jgi:hypothetical protein
MVFFNGPLVGSHRSELPNRVGDFSAASSPAAKRRLSATHEWHVDTERIVTVKKLGTSQKTKSLFVRHHEQVQKEVAELLDQLRHLAQQHEKTKENRSTDVFGPPSYPSPGRRNSPP